MTALMSKAGTSNSSAPGGPGARPGPGGRRRGGFTLIELLVVMGILALVAGVVAPSVGLVGQGGGLDAAARRVGGAVHEARVHAGRTRTWAELTIIPDRVVRKGAKKGERTEVVLRLRGRDADGEPLDLGRSTLPEGVELHDVLVEGMGEDEDFDPGKAVVLRFHPRGITLPAAVRLEKDGEVATVCVHPVTGVSLIDDWASLEQCKREN